MSDFPGKGKVAVIKTSPETVLQDVERVMELAGFREALPKGPTTALKINISWQTWYPACSSTPWQIEGVGLALKKAGYTDLVGVHNDTVVVDARDGEFNNKHRFVTDKLGIPCIYLYEEQFEWFEYKPKRPFLVLDKVYPQGVFIPKALVGKNIVHLPTVKCVHPDTEVVLADGTLACIADLVEGALKEGGVALLDHDGDTRIPARAALLSLSDGGTLGPQATRYFWRTPLNGRKIWRIRTKTGREVKVSSEHPFLTPQGWQRAATLHVKDRIAIPRRILVNGVRQSLPALSSPNRKQIDPDTLPLKGGRRFSADTQREIVRAYLSGEEVKQIAEAHRASITSVKRIIQQAGVEPRQQRNWAVTAPMQTSPDFWRWVGYFAAEGYLSPKNYFVMVNSDPAIQADYAALTHQLFNTEVTFERGKEAKFRSDQLAEFFAQLGWSAPLKAENKRVPPLLFKCTNEEIAAFLAGYFDGDATIASSSNPNKHSYALVVSSKSERLIKEAQYLLARLGVVSFKKHIWNKVASSAMAKRCYHTLSVYSEDLIRLASHLRLQSRHKQKQLEAAFTIHHDTNWDTSPLPGRIFNTSVLNLAYLKENSVNFPAQR
ncbi:MAG TPA: LAGLIDADG family homing endonuclease [Anaerolineales bacterium]|nr:LAGLIDADG family homing endonuclease [Anaerolineales bacterium]